MAGILLVGDHSDYGMAGDALQRAGHEVRFVSNWSPAAELTIPLAPQLVIASVFRPGAHGLEVLQRLRAHFVHLPIIALAGRGLALLEIALLNVRGATRVVDQSQSLSTLPALVNALLAGIRPPSANGHSASSDSGTP